ncbi:MAG: lytic transglycosylase domain-containing protein, partial [Advenella sp.]
PAWVYGLIRQESRFVTAARSSVGAAGLMQVMPGTARLVSRKLGLSYSAASANDFDTNTLLGTSYLKMTLDDLNGSEVLATAGYNAGPNRARRWRDSLSQPLEGAIFAETIPFTETRLYVKHVLSNATWYDARFSGRPQSIVERLGQVRP